MSGQQVACGDPFIASTEPETSQENRTRCRYRMGGFSRLEMLVSLKSSHLPDSRSQGSIEGGACTPHEEPKLAESLVSTFTDGGSEELLATDSRDLSDSLEDKSRLLSRVGKRFEHRSDSYPYRFTREGNPDINNGTSMSVF